MKLIAETTTDYNVIVEESSGNKRLFIEGVFMQAEKKNRNGRVYPLSTLSNEVDRYINEQVSNNRAFGELGHPSGPAINADRICMRIVELKQNGTDYVGRAQITSTPMGQIVRGLIEDGAQLGVSSRGLGSLKERNGIMEVQSDFRLMAIDVVTDPSAPDAFVNGIMEGVDYFYDNGKLIEKSAIDARQEIEEAARQHRLNESKKLQIFQRFLENLSTYK